MRQFAVRAERGVIGFGPVRALLATGRAAEWPREALIGLKLIAPDHPACATVEDEASLTDAARAHDRIRFFLRDRLIRTFRDVGGAWLDQVGPCTVEVVGAEHLDDGSRLFFDTLAGQAGGAVSVRYLVGLAGTTGLLPAAVGERERRVEHLAAHPERLSEDDTDFLYEQAVAYLGTGDSWTAERILRAVLHRRPTPAVWGRAGLAYAMLGRTLEAEFCYLRWCRDEDVTSAAGAYYGLSMLYARHHPAHLRSVDRAAEHLEEGYRILDAAPDDTEDLEFHKVFNRNGYALVEFRRGRVAEAIAHLTDGIAKLRDGSARHHMHQTVLIYNLAQCHRRSGDLERAIATYRQLLDVDGKMPEYHMELAGCLLDSGRYAEARESLIEARRLGPSIPEVHALLGFTDLQLGRAEEAVASYRQAYAYSPGDFDALYDYAYALAETDQPRSVLRLLRDTGGADLTPDQSVKLLTLTAEQNTLIGDLAAARDALDEAVVLAPDDPVTRANRDRVVAAMA